MTSAGPKGFGHISAQELGYPADFDYESGSPHLKHPLLRQQLLDRLRRSIGDVQARGLALEALEIGAGDGSVTQPLLAYGCSVTATEMSRASIQRLQRRYGLNPAFESLFDPDGSLSVLEDRRFTMVVFASVLHHIPDYVSALDTVCTNHLQAGGTLVCFQDPLWYPTVPRSTRALTAASYLTWRLTQGNYTRGVKTRLRRLRGIYDESDVSDMVEYHAVRHGVNEQAVKEALDPLFARVALTKYWSTQPRAGQWLGSALGATNTFAIEASSFRGS